MSATELRPSAPDHALEGATPPARRRRSRTFGEPSAAEKFWRYAALIFVLFVTVGPFLWQLSTSLRSSTEDIYTENLSLLPQQPTLGNYVRVFQAIDVWRYIGNSLFVAAVAVVGNVVFSTAAGYALARLSFRFKKWVLGLFMITLILPAEATIISQYVTVRDLGLADTLLGVALPGMVSVLNVLLMFNAFRQLPTEIEEAAVVDGANAWQRLIRVALPSVYGTIAVVAIFSFIGAWDDFLWPLIVLTTPENFTLTIGLQYLSGTFTNDMRLIAAGTMIAFIPIAVVFGVLQRFFFKGVEEGGVKG
ncbi:carbohydrate ABC transporter permease [Arthrobacter sp. Y-9]|uniref:carbohydrate ABC transporter permease n=1 Tax=Arthrobacter sp. Y-9 TaxID=3039385 RepID=UPI00241CF79C|nr:carbohydrate ABC transporter permease [Arthrobacter sp. Y-9]WFR84122.1 carbohydrate ABC transporter permease [Arthrobacter sp. Y-9]